MTVGASAVLLLIVIPGLVAWLLLWATEPRVKR